MSADPGFLARLRQRLNSGDSILTRDVRELVRAGKPIDESVLEELETRLLLADCGVDATVRIIDGLRTRARKSPIEGESAVLDALAAEMTAVLEPLEQTLELDASRKPFVMLVVGVNGVGKTTTIGKLAARYKAAGLRVMLAAADTFRAAAVAQLVAWGERNQVPVIAQAQGSDPAAVAFDALQAAVARDIDVLIVDTAGRLHTKDNLMSELKKVHRVLGRHEGAPHEVLLVLDATTGQNALAQAATFNAAVPLTGVVLTKLDGGAKGGILFALAASIGTPVRYIGIGEDAADLDEFAASPFTDALLERTA